MLSTMNYLGEAYLHAGDTIIAKEIFKKELLLAKIYEQSNAEGSAYEGLGKCFQWQSLDSSIFYLTKARTIWKNDMQLKEAINSILMAETYLEAGTEYSKNAEEYLQQSINLLLYSIGYGQHQLRWCYRMAELKIETRQYSKAKEYLDKAGLYATSPARVLITMVSIFVIFSLIYVVLISTTAADIIASVDDSLSVVARSFYHSAITFLTIGYGDHFPYKSIRWISSVEGFAGLFLMSYFTVAFVRKVLR